MSEEVRGPVILREKPYKELVDRQAYALPPDCDLDDYEGAAAWVKFNGGEVKHVDDEGLLVVSRYIDEDGDEVGIYYHEWIEENSLIVFDSQIHEFTVYGHSMAHHYVVEPSAGDLSND